MKKVWLDVFHAPASPLGAVALRAVVAAHALWIVLSRPSLPSLFAWPRVFWTGAAPDAQLRHAWGILPVSGERILYVVLVVALALTLAGFRTRVAALVAGVLLYHFAPLENALAGTADPFECGLTLDVLALCVVAFAPRARLGDEWSALWRWPLAITRLGLALQYFFSTVGKLNTSGLAWFSGPVVRDLAITLDFLQVAPAPGLIVGHPAVAWTIGVGWLLLSLSMLWAVVSSRAASVLVPLAAAAHIAAMALLGIVFLEAPLLVLFANWDRLDEPLRVILEKGRPGRMKKMFARPAEDRDQA